ncbi:MAG: FISUMP domain-containing protein [Fulvivirga sp.]
MKLKLLLITFLVILTCCNPVQESVLVDADGQKYLVKKYGETFWMTENLKTKQDTAGNPIKYYFPNGDSTNIATFGLLYDFETACNICPNGWELPTNEDWKRLLKSSGGNVAGIYKESQYWEGENNSNSSNFSARPAGFGNNGEYENQFKSKTLFWSNSKEDEHFIWTYIFELGKDSIRVASQHPTYAFSVRCVKSINP